MFLQSDVDSKGAENIEIIESRVKPSTSNRLSDFPQFTDYQVHTIDWAMQSTETEARHENMQKLNILRVKWRVFCRLL